MTSSTTTEALDVPATTPPSADTEAPVDQTTPVGIKAGIGLPAYTLPSAEPAASFPPTGAAAEAVEPDELDSDATRVGAQAVGEFAANDGQRLSEQAQATQALFTATWDAQAAQEWVKEHNAALASSASSSAPAAAAPAATDFSNARPVRHERADPAWSA